MSSSSLTIQLFGPLRVLVNGVPLPRMRTRSIEWLLALLVLRAGRITDRSWLAGTLWIDSTEQQAMHNLRNALMHLRKALGSEGHRILSPTRDTLSIDLAGAEVDVLAFDRAVQNKDESSLQTALALYAGPLLEGCYEEWITLERQKREQDYLSVLETLATFVEQSGKYSEAIALLRRAAAIDGLRDSIQRNLMRVLAADGDIPAALMTYREYRVRLHDELNAEPDDETTELFQQIRRGREEGRGGRDQASGVRGQVSGITGMGPVGRGEGAENELPQTPHSSARSQVPHPLTALIGREEALGAVLEKMSESRLVTLVGAGGVGKTRLALEAAAQFGQSINATVAWVELARVADSDFVLPAIGAALGISRGSELNGEDLAGQILAQMGTGRCLITLDNCEHLIDTAADAVERLVQGHPGICVLATSRQRLGLAGEAVWHVPSLAAPEPDTLPSDSAEAVSCALSYPAVQLFVERAGAARPGFRLADRENAAAICTLCRRLDGIPLAIELAAARVGALKPVQLAARLDDRFALLTQGTRTALPRQKTLRALIDWSYNLLTDEESSLLRLLTVFADSWTLETAEVISNMPALDLLSSLAEKSLIVAEERPDGLRYRMLETIREYARESLISAGEEDWARHRFLDWVVALSEGAYTEMLGPRPEAALDLLEAELANIRAALAMARENTALSETYLRLTAALWPFWDSRGYVPEGHVHILEAVRRPNLTESPAMADALLGAVVLTTQDDVHTETIAFLNNGFNLFRSIGDKSGAASMQLLKGHIALRLLHTNHAMAGVFDYTETSAILSEALALCRELNWTQATGLVLVHLALLAQIEGDTERVQPLREEGWSLLELGDDGRTPAYCLNRIYDLAMPLYLVGSEPLLLEKSLAIARKLGGSRRIASIFTVLGVAAEAKSDTAFAITCFQEAAQARRDMCNPHALCEALQNLGNSHYHLGDYQSAYTIYTESLEIFRKLGYAVNRAANNLGSTLYHLGEPERARGLHREALASYGSNIHGITWSLERLGVVEAHYGDPISGARILGAAANAREESGDPRDRWDQADWDRATAAVSSALGGAEFERIFEAACVAGWQLAVERILNEP